MITNMLGFSTITEILQIISFSIIELVLLSFFNLIVVFIIIQYIYDSFDITKEYRFSYILIGVTVFFLCYVLGNIELQLGFALGLFAIFGIIRYRTDAIPIKEMTYLFLVIGISVINALASREVSYLEIVFVNIFFIIITVLLEKAWRENQLIKRKIIYEKIELVKPDNYDKLIQDLQERTGLEISKVVVGNMDFLKDTAEIIIFAKKHEKNIAKRNLD